MPVVHLPPPAQPASGGSGGLIALLVVGLVASIGVGAVFLVRSSSAPPKTEVKSGPVRSANGKRDPATKKKAPKVTLMDALPLLADANGDGVDDLILRIRRDRQTAHAVYDPKAGKLIWSTDAALQTHSERTFVAAGRLFEVDAKGQVTAYLLADGKKQWTTSLGEKLKHFCRGDDKSLVVLTEAKEVKRLDAAAGGQSAESADACVPELGSGSTSMMRMGMGDPRNRRDYHAPPGVEGFICGSVRVGGSANYVVPDRCLQEGIGYESLDGMASYRIWRDGDGFLVLGYKRPGTRIPMVARARPRANKPDWAHVVPTGNPLDALAEDPKAATIVGDRLVVGWSAGITAFDKKTGERSWTVEGSADRLLTAGPYVVAWSRGRLRVLDPKNGKPRHRFGE